MKISNFDMKYVIDFPIQGDKVLMIRRNKHPWVNKWNGAGGHIEVGETPLHAIFREILEETGVNLKEARRTFYTGIVTWDIDGQSEYIPGMYSFTSELQKQQKVWTEERIIREGIVAWKPLQWICSKDNKEVADNIPYFLPLMISTKKPMRYHCVFANGKIKSVDVLSLPNEITSELVHRTRG